MSTDYEKAYNELLVITTKEDISPQNIVNVTIELMQKLEMYKTLTGDQKKNLTLNSVMDTLILQNKNPNSRIVTYITEAVLPFVIDALKKIDNKQIRIAIGKCSGKLLSCCKK